MLAASAPGEKVSGKVYNTASGESHTLLETYEILARLTGFEEGLSRTIEWYAAELGLDMNLANHSLGDAHLYS